MPPICCLSKHRQASHKFSGIARSSLLQIQDLCVDVPVSTPVTLTKRGWNDLRQNTHPHSSQLRMPGHHIHLMPSFRWHLCSISPAWLLYCWASAGSCAAYGCCQWLQDRQSELLRSRTCSNYLAGWTKEQCNQSTFPIKNVKPRWTITPGCLCVLDQKFSEQLQWL